MIERHITFKVHEHRTADFERFFADVYRPGAARTPGYVSLELLREMEQRSRYQMVFRWETRDAATAWRTSPEHQDLQPGLEELHDGMEIVAYDVVR